MFQTSNIFFPLDTFASKTAAIEDETADASVGNVTGSNAVNVFLGIGIAWTMAAVYWEAQGLVFEVEPGRYIQHVVCRNMITWFVFSPQFGILRHHLLYWGLACHLHPVLEKKSSRRWWTWWTKTFQDHFIRHLRLLLVFLCCYFCSGGIRSNQARLLRRKLPWLLASEPLCMVSGHCAVIARGLKTLKYPVLLQACHTATKFTKWAAVRNTWSSTFPPLETQLFRSQVKSVRSLRRWRKAQDASCVRRHVATCATCVTCQFVVIIPLLFLAILSWWVRRKRLKLFGF